MKNSPLSTITNLLNRLTYPQKFIFISLLFMLPLAMLYPLAREQSIRIEQYGRDELYGTLYLRPLTYLTQEIQRHQLATTNLSNAADVADIQNEIETHFLSLQDLQSQYGSILQVDTEVDTLIAGWDTLKVSLSTSSNTEIVADHQQLLTDIRSLISYVGDTSFLILDPDLDTYYMMDTILLKQPRLQSRLFETHQLIQTIVAEQIISTQNRVQLSFLTGLLESDLATMNQNISVGLRNNDNGAMAPLVEPALATTTAVTQQFINDVENQLLNIATVSPDDATLLEDATETLVAHFTLYEATSEALEVGLQTRINFLTNQLVILIAISISGVIIAFVTGLYLMLTISRPISELAQATNQFAAGNMESRVSTTGLDEIGQVGIAFNKMAEQVQQTLTQIEKRNQVIEVSRNLSTILDSRQLATGVVEQVQKVFDYYHVHIYLWDEGSQQLVITGGTGEAGAMMLSEGHTLTLDQGLVGQVATNNKAILVADVSQEAGWLPNPLLPETKAETAVPISVRDKVLGVLDVQQNRVGGLSQSDVELLESIADQVAIGLQNATLFEQIQHQADRELLINAISEKIENTTTMEDILDVAARELRQAFGAQRTIVELSAKPEANRQ